MSTIPGTTSSFPTRDTMRAVSSKYFDEGHRLLRVLGTAGSAEVDGLSHVVARACFLSGCTEEGKGTPMRRLAFGKVGVPVAYTTIATHSAFPNHA